MQELRDYLAANPIDKLAADYAINLKYRDDKELVIATYDQIDSPKTHPIVRQCRGTVIKVATKEIVARGFHRFFNYSEFREDENKFNWNNFSAVDKEDGSLVIMYYYGGQWHVNTRGSFATHPMDGTGFNGTWRDLFLSTIDISVLEGIRKLKGSYSLVFELCSPYNKVVRSYSRPQSYLLAAFHTATGQEESDGSLDVLAGTLKCLRPRVTPVRSIEDVHDLLKRESDPTFEGVVLRDNAGMRIKLKKSEYIALHRLADNKNLASDANLIPLVIKGEISEVLTHFSELTERLLGLSKVIFSEYHHMVTVWELARNIKEQKAFALFVCKYTKLSSFLFEARKRKCEPKVIWDERAEDFFTKNINGFSEGK